ncbi:MAG: succinate dehydrogenase [Flavobacteriales bacterium]|nr:succinate dehydrogenase [Flavobacteriales bacterium]
MSNSSILKSSIAKKYWMALTGLFLCTFLIGHLLGNLQLIFIDGEEGRRSFNEYAYFMTHNPAIKILSYLTYISILFHAATHMANFWWKVKFTQEIPLHTYKIESKQEMNIPKGQDFYYTHVPSIQPIPKDTNSLEEKGTAIYYKNTNIKIADGYIDLHKVVMTFFSKSNPNAIFGVLFYVLSMLVLAFHLWHGFASAFQSLGVNHAKWTPIIKNLGKGFAVFVPLLFALIPILIYLNN